MSGPRYQQLCQDPAIAHTFHAVPVGVEVFHKSRSSRTIKFNSLQFLDNNTLQLSLTSCH